MDAQTAVKKLVGWIVIGAIAASIGYVAMMMAADWMQSQARADGYRREAREAIGRIQRDHVDRMDEIYEYVRLKKLSLVKDVSPAEREKLSRLEAEMRKRFPAEMTELERELANANR